MKRNSGVLMAAALTLTLTLTLTSGCQTNEQTGLLLGGGAGALMGGLLGNAVGGRSGTLIGAAIGGLGGAFAGSLIGRNLDARDRQQAQEATRLALISTSTQPVAWTSDQNVGDRKSVV